MTAIDRDGRGKGVEPGTTGFEVVIPTVGRPSLVELLRALDQAPGPRPGLLIVVDDRRRPSAALELPALRTLTPTIVRGGGRGPAAARNAGWRRCSAAWVAFLDDDVMTAPTWFHDLAADLGAAGADPNIVASTGTVSVPLPTDRPPTDDERGTANLAHASWITADMAVRRRALVASGGFDERFPRAYREDTEFAMRLVERGWRIVEGSRSVEHPPRRGRWNASVRAQRGNADDALVRRLHGPDWRERGRAPRGALRSHVLTSALASSAALVAVRRPRPAAALAGLVAGRIGTFWLRRVSAGPTSLREWSRLAASSALIPFTATFWALWGRGRARLLAPGGPRDQWTGGPPALVLFDRDGTLVHDVPYNGDPDRVVPVADARASLDRLRAAGVAVGLVTNQSAIGRGDLDRRQVDAVNRRVEALLGPFATVQVCPHTEHDRCRCRKPAAGMVLAAAAEMRVPPHRCAVVGDIGSDVDAGLAAGARAVLVPNAATASTEISDAPEVAASLAAATSLLLDGEALDAGDPSGRPMWGAHR